MQRLDIWMLLPALLAGAGIPACSGTGPGGAPSSGHVRDLLAEGRLPEAEDEAAALVAAAAGNPDDLQAARALRGCVRIERGDAGGAIDDLESAGPLDKDESLCLGKAYFLAGSCEAALPLLLPPAKAGRGDAESCRMAIRCMLTLERFEEALALAEATVKRFPKDNAVRLSLAQAQALNGRIEDALATLDACARSAPDDPEVPFVRGNLLWGLDRFEEAIAQYRKALELNPAFPEALRNMGAAMLQAGYYEDAAHTLAAALEIMPDDVEVMNNLAVALASTGRTAEALALYDRALANAPDDPTLLNNAADVYLRCGEVDKALAAVRRLVQVAPERENARVLYEDLLALQALLPAVCDPQAALVPKVEAAFAAEGLSPEAALAACRRITQDPRFSALVEQHEKACPPPDGTKEK